MGSLANHKTEMVLLIIIFNNATLRFRPQKHERTVNKIDVCLYLYYLNICWNSISASASQNISVICCYTRRGPMKIYLCVSSHSDCLSEINDFVIIYI
jgi:hypothetical protein